MKTVRSTGAIPSYPGRKSFAQNLNEIGVVAPRGFGPVNESGHVFAKLHHDLPWTPDSEV